MGNRLEQIKTHFPKLDKSAQTMLLTAIKTGAKQTLSCEFGRLAEINEILDGYGVGLLSTNDRNVNIYYVNMGDAQKPTFLLVHKDARIAYQIGCKGDYIENHKNLFREE